MICRNVNDINEDTSGVIFVYADWCEHCENSKEPMFNLMESFPDVDFYCLDAEREDVEVFMENRHIKEIPYFGVMVEGEMISSHSGVIYTRDEENNSESIEFFNDFKNYLELVFN